MAAQRKRGRKLKPTGDQLAQRITSMFASRFPANDPRRQKYWQAKTLSTCGVHKDTTTSLLHDTDLAFYLLPPFNYLMQSSDFVVEPATEAEPAIKAKAASKTKTKPASEAEPAIKAKTGSMTMTDSMSAGPASTYTTDWMPSNMFNGDASKVLARSSQMKMPVMPNKPAYMAQRDQLAKLASEADRASMAGTDCMAKSTLTTKSALTAKPVTDDTPATITESTTYTKANVPVESAQTPLEATTALIQALVRDHKEQISMMNNYIEYLSEKLKYKPKHTEQDRRQ
ncbi:hypothetical protein F503_07128 [Ophiostoma piceae UAMH 11346]|uniref:Uncharacterized protein n=1 Tax=Ophiostoma piceae (strain UAMH 11346) TaxID=1262450 RepID=S3C923_OPHP1|nr:hypothetical protein F503_07128 [Ophiostoma piceae UAMH 11346]